MRLTALDLYRCIEQINDTPAPAPGNLRAKYVLLHKVLAQACLERTAGVTFAFANLFSRLDYVCKQARMTPADRFAVQTLRRNGHAASGVGFVPSMEEYGYDLRALTRFVSLVFGEEVPATLAEKIPASGRPFEGTRRSRLPYLRVAVTGWDDTVILAATDSDVDPIVQVDYAHAGYDGDLCYLREVLHEDMQLNLLDVYVDENGCYVPRLIVVEPDYLIDISALAACFREYGHHPLNYFVQRLKPRANTYHRLLGNLAGQLLDDLVNEPADQPVDYARSLKKFFATAALDFCTCALPPDFHEQARQQLNHLRTVIRRQLPADVSGFDRSQVLLEASFVCERLGLQGRADLLQKDLSLLVEQKSGKRDEFRHRHKEDHFVQMMLYQGVLEQNFHVASEQLRSFLLYSKYPDGLTAEHFAEGLFRESIHLRNRIVAQELAFADGDIARVWDELTADLLNEAGVRNRLWTDYQKPELEAFLRTLQDSSPLEKAYVQRLFTFVSRELLLAKTGGRDEPGRGFASLWNLPVAEKLEAGNLLMGLRLRDKRRSRPDGGFDLVELALPAQEEDFLPNFRRGDIVVLYAYEGEPDARRQLLMKGSLVEVWPDRLTVLLRNGLQNPDLIGNEEDTFAVEHDGSDTSATLALRGLYTFLAARKDRKELLLGTRPPETDPTRTLNGDYGRFNAIVLKEKQCVDYFLLVGPPGTGKTSCALRYMVEEALTEPDASLLLLSYTNRAVDEICDMLVGSGIADRHGFLRLGSESACDERFRPYLLPHSLEDCPRLADIRQRLLETRIVTGTTTALNSRLNLLGMKRFAMAIIDEASQILEPDVVGLLAARNEGANAIGKFVLVGDYKQLPAIALQGADEARVTDPLLTSIGLTDCRNSLFERLYRRSEERCRSVLHRQGRMHPALADFPSHAFYYREQLEPVPLPHQQETGPYAADRTAADALDTLLLTRRMVFVPSRFSAATAQSDKVNPEEARIVATLLERIYRLTAPAFDPYRTVGVIVPYRGQIAMIRKEIDRLGLPALHEVSIDTVERYQGSQRDVILYSFTASQRGQLAFLTSNTFEEEGFVIDRKLNVAITRARKQLVLTGHPDLLAADPTFFKLLEYIRLHDGYVETTADRFCQGDFELPSSEGRTVAPEHYPLGPDFADLYRRYAALPDEALEEDTLNRELTAYGRTDFTADSLPECTPEHRLALYAHYYMCRHYSAARSVLEAGNNWLLPALRAVTGRVLVCDCSFECGASAFAFADVCRPLTNRPLHYVGICRTPEMEALTSRLWASEAYRWVDSRLCPDLSAVPDSCWSAHPGLRDLVVFQLSNCFDRISLAQARELAAGVNRIVRTYPHHHYIVLYRDDAGALAAPHTYQAFCARLTPELRPLSPSHPCEGRFYYRITDKLEKLETKRPGMEKQETPETNAMGTSPAFHRFLYEIRSR